MYYDNQNQILTFLTMEKMKVDIMWKNDDKRKITKDGTKILYEQREINIEISMRHKTRS